MADEDTSSAVSSAATGAAAGSAFGPWGAVIGGALGLVGSLFSSKESSAQADENRAFQERMSSTAHQREVVDLRAAGLNPILSATGGRGASTPGGAQGQVFDPGPGMQSSANAVVRQEAEVDLLRAQAEASRATRSKLQAEADYTQQDVDAREVGRGVERPAYEIGDDGKLSINIGAPRTRAQEAYLQGLSSVGSEARSKAIAAQVAEQYGMSSAEAQLRVANALEKLQKMQTGKAASEVGLNQWELKFLRDYGVLERGVAAGAKALGGLGHVGIRRGR
ncbi:MAG: DNA pilot protein [Microviridae sp.]|nr:MAG: DNA pilot protein [Microviridae sp.]